MYHEFNRHRKEEFLLCEQAITEVAQLYSGIITADRFGYGGEAASNRIGCNELGVLLDKLHESMKSLDQKLEEIAMEPAASCTRIYDFSTLGSIDVLHTVQSESHEHSHTGG